MVFEITGKVALISGGASGIGLRYAKELLRSGLKGVTLADVNNAFGQKALQEIEKEFGPKKAIYVQTDVTDMKSFENAFKKTIEAFQNLDILINNAGILNDATWEKEVAININGVIHGVLLGLENYIPKYKSSAEGVIVNISSIAGIKEFSIIPIYTATKFAVMGMSKAFGDEDHYNRTKVKVLALCPGVTDTPLITEIDGKNLGPPYQKLLEENLSKLPSQQPECVARAMVKIIKNAKTGTVWVAEGGQEPYEFILPERESFAPE
ncbi:15-hydroxyprostaglandin dehydrogenase [NAD(+)] isoform X1 [Tribolium castaneum]|uniref:Fat body protein 2-like Protein n=1 Tax=Tribolium castaneum TaxID=7070 RepID=D6WG91_TRICA|nr:PREDICTED: 15-hydroxyprostaglandin dehydrogenase [NAD(+)] [Tribolium castaneum]EFA00962.1 Fat body protein 2-like Protein [Tribolium castaneum]|eukprot:XP_966889.1 PREDICTED: 15-hydroxyprostaglandin dehydrogenase [NAD(+)] [Tribolium castaneum]